ncbi:MAG TPA: DUF721 domain-containing protein [Acidiferrobacteraceae bacterium]|nr:DUF721 domain-containing protein [Acidiferrobacteraceae bacterium]
MSHKGFRSLATILADTLGDANQGLSGALVRHDSVLASIQAGWAKTAPAPLKDHCRPTHYQAGQLTVETDSSAWASRLRHQCDELVQALRRLSGLSDLVQIRIKVNPQPPRASPQTHTKSRSRR